ncbi:MAG: hypothetical protein AAF821_13400 [Cyanobacteria bacterium P01_D01_bin.156]
MTLQSIDFPGHRAQSLEKGNIAVLQNGVAVLAELAAAMAIGVISPTVCQKA